MSRFQEIMHLMNNGLYNKSTLHLVVPEIISLGLEKNPNNIEQVMMWMMSEEELKNPHPGLNEVNEACRNIVSPFMQKEEARLKTL